jgi:cytidylate kinase
MSETSGFGKPIVAIDGPAGSGKSSVAREVARFLGWTYVTTGAIYRALGLILNENKLSVQDKAGLDWAVGEISRLYRQESETGLVFLGDRNVSTLIKSPAISEMASVIAADANVRFALLPVQRQVVENCRGAVVDGRDMGTVVFPDALVKVFLTASSAERARRRASELASLGKEADPLALAKEIDARDHRDASRVTAPMVPAADAVTIDSTNLDMPSVVQRILEICAVAGIVAEHCKSPY